MVLSAKAWRCVVCGYVHEGSAPPAYCPICAAPATEFEEISAAPGGLAAPDGAAAAGISRIVIIGAGIAGLSAAESARKAAPGAEIILLSGEQGLPYYRLSLTRYLAGEVTAAALPVYAENWYTAEKIVLLRGEKVSAIVGSEKTIRLASGRTLTYDRLVLAMGASAFMPPFPGRERKGVRTLRTVDDADYILEAQNAGASCTCIGGGILGLETAAALARRGMDVTLLESSGWLMPRQLNQRAAGILAGHMAQRGVEIVYQARTREILGGDTVAGVVLEDGREINAGLVVVATGVRPNTSLLRDPGIPVEQGVIVDDYLCTADPAIYAAGDVTQHRGMLYGLWGPAQFQGGIAGANAAGARLQFGGIPRSTTLKVVGVDVFSIGEISGQGEDIVTIEAQADGSYQCYVFRAARLKGAILIGRTELSAAVKKAVEAGTDFTGLLKKKPGAGNISEFLQESSVN